MKINPKKLTPEKASILYSFFKAQTSLGTQIWDKEKTYSFENNKFEFDHVVVQRKRKEGKRGVRYEFVSEKALGTGQYGSVFEISGTLALGPRIASYKLAGYQNKTRAIKIQKHHATFPETRAIKEYDLTKIADHLAVKEPVIQNEISYSVMRKIEGLSLTTIINDDYKEIKKLTLQQRLDLSKALLNALKNQVSDKGIIHRDVKGDNIFVELINSMVVTIFDYGLSVDAGKPDGMSPGTPAYAAPEIFFGAEQTFKVDVFSMARTLSLLWRVDLESYLLEDTLLFAKNSREVNLSKLFIDLSELSLVNRDIIKSILEKMLLPKSSERLDVDQAIAEFEKIEDINKPDHAIEPPLAELINSQARGNHSFFSKTKPSGTMEKIGTTMPLTV